MSRLGQVPKSSRVGVSEQIISVALFIVGMVSYQQLAAPFCAGSPHTLPKDSRLLAEYPCGGSGFQRTAYVLRHTPHVLHDIVRLGMPDFWVTVAILALAVRMTAAFTLPARIYNQVVAPATMYVERAIMPAFHFLRGSRHRPSTMSLRCMFNTYPVFDLVFFCSLLGVWEVNTAVEMTYCLWAAINHVLLCSWHKDIAPGGPANVAWQISSRLLVMVTTFYLSLANTIVAGRRQQARRASFDSTVAVAARGNNATACRSQECRASFAGSAKEETAYGGLGKAVTDQAQEQEQRHCGSFDVLVPQGALAKALEGSTSVERLSELTLSAAARKAAGGVSASDAAAAVGEWGSSDSKTVPTGAVPPCLKGDAPLEHQHQQAVFGAPPSLNSLNCAAAKASSAAARRVSAIRPYRSPVHRTLMRVKIPWAEPDQLVPGFEQRLADSAAKQGLVLSGTYVRAGCVELVLMLEGLPEQQQRQQLLLPQSPPPLVKEGEGLRGASDSAVGTGHGLEITAVLRALGLEPRTGDGAAAAAATAPRDGFARGGLEPQSNWICSSWKEHFESRPDGVTVAFHRVGCGMSWEPDVSDGDDGGGRGAYESLRNPSGKFLFVRSLLPRALSLSAALPEPNATTQDSVDTTAAGTATKPVAVLCIRLEWPLVNHQSQQLHQPQGCERVQFAPGEGEPPQIEVLLRSGGIYLPGRIAASRWEVGGGELPSSPHCYNVLDSSGHTIQDGGNAGGGVSGGCDTCERLACMYDVELLAAPAVPGVILLEIHSCKAAAAAAAANAAVAASVSGDALPSEASALDVTAFVDIVPLLVTSNAAVAAEINRLTATWPDGIERELDELLYDLATWEAATTFGTRGIGDAATPASGLGANAGEGEANAAAMGMVLAPHLLHYSESIGLSATAASIRAKMDSLLPPPPVSPQRSQPQQKQLDRAPNCLTKPEMTKAGDECGASYWGPGCGQAGAVGDVCSGGSRGSGRTPDGGRGSQLAAVLSALLEVLGLTAVAPSRAAAYDAFTGAWSVAQGKSVQIVEFLLLLSMLGRSSRAGFLPIGPAATVIVVGCGIGTFTTLAWLVLPYHSWARIAQAAKIPRYLGHFAAKVLVVLGFSAPLGISTYVTGLGALLLEGFIIPGACLVSLRSAAIIAAIKLPANAAMILVIGGTHSTLTAILLAARIEAVALATTIACHVYVCLVYERPFATEAAGLRPAVGTAPSSAMVGTFGGVDVDVDMAPMSKCRDDVNTDKSAKAVH